MKEEQDKKTKSKLVLHEEKILEFWNNQDIFKKTLSKDSPRGEFVFYDGPPFANGLPHYGHILAGTIKDILPRYKTMCGYHVPRRWGWDCHGLPVENVVEKELGLSTKKDIEAYGIEKFNAKAKESVMQYADEWRKQIPRFGRFVDMENDYRTMDTGYTESVWWAFKTLSEKGLVYEGYKSMHVCPRCETTLSNFEVNQGYKDITDISVFVKFELTEEPNTYLLAWTTTPWTLPGNVALAVNPDTTYVKYSWSGKQFIVAKKFFSPTSEHPGHLISEFLGKDLIGKSYKPLYEYYANDTELLNRKNGWKVYGASFVTTEDGTGIVHIAPAFGEDDMNLGKEKGLPFVQHVSMNGKFKKEIRDFPHDFSVKPKDDHQKMDVEIIKNLAGRELLFDKKKIIHSYPHCWRCDTPLLNYAASSWFVKVTDIKDSLVKANKKTSWVPAEIRDGRFGNWLSGARDWAISRSRFWGAPIPVWKSETGEVFIPGNLGELMERTRAKNRYIVMRHGEASSNVKNVLSSSIEGNPHPLTEKGKEQAKESAKSLKDKGVSIIIHSPVRRASETAQIVAKTLGVGGAHLVSDIRLREVMFGDLDGHSALELSRYPVLERFKKPLPHGESYEDIQHRMSAVISDMEKRYTGKTILIVTHDAPAWMLFTAAENLSPEKSLELHDNQPVFLKNAEARDLAWRPLPRNTKGEIDLHRPFIDDVLVYDTKNLPMKRVSDVFDCWFESGSMPFGEACYIGEVKKGFNPKSGLFKRAQGFPADFIAEGLDQTRGWFYSLSVLGVALFGKSPFKNVIVNGIVLAENGEKMSKRLKNYPDPMAMVNTYGADALRYYLVSSPVVSAEDLRFSEKGVDEVAKKLLQRLDNVITFYEMYSSSLPDEQYVHESKNVLDMWVLARLNETIELVTKNLELYALDKASRPLMDFVDDLSNWYVRRSRDRFKSDDVSDRNSALYTTRTVLITLSKLLAPFTPFFAEYIYSKLTVHNGRPVSGSKESVHLESWPEIVFIRNIDSAKLIEAMTKVRTIATLGLEARAKAKINVRQPLSVLQIKNGGGLTDELLKILSEEINVKQIVVNEKIEQEVSLNVEITHELKEEGDLRDFIRGVQDARKTAGFKVGEIAKLTLDDTGTARSLCEKFSEEIKKATQLSHIKVLPLLVGTEVRVGEAVIKINLDK